MSGLNMMDMIMSAAGGKAPQEIGQQFGLDGGQSQNAISALLPAISSGLKQNASSPQGLAGLLGALQDGSHDQYLDNPSNLSRPDVVDEGNGILGHLFGSKEVSRAVAAKASEKSGISTDILKKMLPMVAMMAMGSLNKQTRSQQESGGLKAMLGQMAMQQLMGGQTSGDQKSGGLGSMIGGILGGGARKQESQQKQAHQQGLGMLGKMLDADGDGNTMDDVLGMVMNRK